jgi:hypothetical protein
MSGPERTRLEELRADLRAERISYAGLAELADLAEHIEDGDVELLEAAGVPEGMTGPEWARPATDATIGERSRTRIKMSTTTEIDNARNQAAAQIASVQAMVARLRHAEDCDGDTDDCELTDDEINEGLGYYGDVDDDDRERYHDADEARQRIEEDALSVEVSGTWTPGETPEADGFEILLCTGGPAVKIVGELGLHDEPTRAWVEYQDWGTPWAEYVGEDYQSERADLLAYARCFYFGGGE